MKTPAKIRLHKYLAECGIASRRKSEELISSGLVLVDGVRAEVGQSVTGEEKITVSGKLIRREKPVLFLFHKPRGVITSLNDPERRPTVGEYLREIKERIYPVGRLDFDVSGLLLLTNDGEFADRCMHPKYGVKKVYIARVGAVADSKTLKQLTRGIQLEDGPAKALRATLAENPREKLLGALGEGESVVELEVDEGRKHFVKRLLAEVGLPVIRLARIGFGPFELGALQPGQLKSVRFPDKIGETPRPRLTKPGSVRRTTGAG